MCTVAPRIMSELLTESPPETDRQNHKIKRRKRKKLLFRNLSIIRIDETYKQKQNTSIHTMDSGKPKEVAPNKKKITSHNVYLIFRVSGLIMKYPTTADILKFSVKWYFLLLKYGNLFSIDSVPGSTFTKSDVFRIILACLAHDRTFLRYTNFAGKSQWFLIQNQMWPIRLQNRLYVSGNNTQRSI